METKSDTKMPRKKSNRGISKRKKIRIKGRKKIQTTPKKMLEYFFQNQIDIDFLDNGITENDIIESNSDKSNKIREAGIEKLKKIILPYGITDLNISHLYKTEQQKFGIINTPNLGNNRNLYFKSYTPEAELLFYNIIACKNPTLFDETNLENPEVVRRNLEEFMKFIDVTDTMGLSKYKITDLLTKNIQGNVTEKLTDIEIVCKLISKFFENTSIILVQDSLPDSRTLIQCDSVDSDITKNEVILIYISYPSTKEFRFEPIININLDGPKKGEEVREGKQKEDQAPFNYTIGNNPGTDTQRTHFQQLLVKIKQESNIPIVKGRRGKKTEEYIEFNPYDKNKDLPIIEITTKTGEKTFLLGTELDGFYNIYEDDNNLNTMAGKVIINKRKSTDNLTVYWCQGFPK